MRATIVMKREQPIKSLSQMLPYVLATDAKYMKQHKDNNIMEIYLVNGSVGSETQVTKDLEMKEYMGDAFSAIIRSRGKNTGNGEITMASSYIRPSSKDIKPDEISNHVMAIIDTVRIWAEATDEPCLMVSHKNEIDSDSTPLEPHIHILYLRDPTKPDRIRNWIYATLLKQNENIETNENEFKDSGILI